MSELEPTANDKLTAGGPSQPLGTTSETVSAVVCRALLVDKTVCGAGPKPGKPDVCTNNHFLEGNRLQWKHGGTVEPSIAEIMADPAFHQFNAEDVLKAQIVGARAMQRRVEKARSRNNADRVAAAEQWNLLSGRIISAQTQLTALDVAKADQVKADPAPWYRRLPDDLLAAVLAFVEGRDYTIEPSRHRFVCVACAHAAGQWGGHVVPPAAPSVVDEDLSDDAAIRLVKR
jgi:hypothetical protein